jgi:hypothetical protein
VKVSSSDLIYKAIGEEEEEELRRKTRDSDKP